MTHIDRPFVFALSDKEAGTLLCVGRVMNPEESLDGQTVFRRLVPALRGDMEIMRRRVVTGHDAEGRSIVVSNGESPGRLENGSWDELWAFHCLPANLADETDPANVEVFRLTPEPSRVAVRIFTVDPIEGAAHASDDLEWERRMDLTETEELDPTSRPWMHRTPTVDVIVVISGEMDLVLDGGETVHVVPGDSVVQRGTMHAWRNSASEPCVSVAFMVRAEAG